MPGAVRAADGIRPGTGIPDLHTKRTERKVAAGRNTGRRELRTLRPTGGQTEPDKQGKETGTQVPAGIQPGSLGSGLVFPVLHPGLLPAKVAPAQIIQQIRAIGQPLTGLTLIIRTYISPNIPQIANLGGSVEKSEYAVTSNELKNQFDIPIQLFLSCIGYQ